MSYTIGKTTNAELEIKTSTGDIRLNPSGVVEIGTDTNLYRSAANTLKTDDDFVVASDVTINGDLTVDGVIMSNSPKRVEFERYEGSTSSTSYVTALDRNGSGKIYWMAVSPSSSQTDADLRITIDGLVSTLTVDDCAFVVPKPNGSTQAAWFKGLSMTDQNGAMVMNIDYQDSLKIEFKCSNGISSVFVKFTYGTD